MADFSTVCIVLIITNFLFSYKGFKNDLFFEGYKFEVDPILRSKDYLRLISSGFLHVDWVHLGFNMFTLYAFSKSVDYSLGHFNFLLVYFASLIGGNLLALFVHRNHGNYSAVGASGAVCGVVFASIAFHSGMKVGLFGLYLPSWLYGIFYVLFTIYGIKSQRDNIGHEAHLGGALVGMLCVLALKPVAFFENFGTMMFILIPTLIFLLLIIFKPNFLLINSGSGRKLSNSYDIDHKYNEIKVTKQQEIDAILEKISKRGIESLSKKEKETLDEYSKSVR
jgi:membrane associated rhomboid family serine protease